MKSPWTIRCRLLLALTACAGLVTAAVPMWAGAAPPPPGPPMAGMQPAGQPEAGMQPVGQTEAGMQKDMAESMARMDRDMMAAPRTGNPDLDFATMMIPHHQGAIEMARAELLHGKDPVLQRLAQEIIVTQQNEIDLMQREVTHLARQDRTSPESGMATGTMQGMGDMAMPVAAAPVPASSRDRVYTADQTSNTVSVIDPAANKLLGLIRLGDPVPAALGPLYKGALLVHGLGYSPDHRTLAVVSIGSNSVTLIDTATNQIKGTIYVGRSPHEAFFTPDGRELWVAVRGENYVAVLDPVGLREIRRIPTASGPGMVLFRPDGEYAFVPSSFTPEVDVIDTHRYAVVARVPQASPFSPNLAVSPDGHEVWFTLKDVGKTQVMSAEPPFHILATLDTGPLTNHVALVDTPQGRFAYVTVGGLNQVKVYRRGPTPELVATIPTGDLPHGIWPSGDGGRLYVGLENGDAVQAIDTQTNSVVATIPTGQLPQALVYVPDAVPTGPGTAGLVSLAEAGQALHVEMAPAPGATPTARATVVVNPLGLVDHLQIAASGLEPGREYQLALVDSPTPPYRQGEPVARFKANPSGSAIAQAIGPLRNILTQTGQAPAASSPTRYLLMTRADTHQPVLVERQP